jgi:transaldolase/glucose-6-phosphate isomerase
MIVESNPLVGIHSHGQSIWLDYLRRGMIVSGDLQRLIDDDGLRGLTSNPSIFEKAIAGSHDYDEVIRTLARKGKSGVEIYQALTVEDVRLAAGLFRSLYDRTGGRDGFVSLEVSPRLAHDTQATIAEAHRLWSAVDCPNLMIKVPATPEGLPAIQQLISEGIHVNVTLLFGLPRYRQVTQAFIAGLEARAKHGKSLHRLASVASFFLSRIDTLIDPMLVKIIHSGGVKAPLAARAKGRVAISSAKMAYQMYKEIFSQTDFVKLTTKGAHPQRLLWASTSVKNPAYSDVMYVEALIGPDTVNTLPLETLNAYRDHGNPEAQAARLEQGLDEAKQVLESLPELGIDLEAISQQLEDEGVDKFIHSFDRLMDALSKAQDSALQGRLDRQQLSLKEGQAPFLERLVHLENENFIPRLWNKDPSLWKSDPQSQKQIKNSLGWLHVAEKMEESLAELHAFSQEVKEAGFQHVIHMGMGGSSLAPLVIDRIFEGHKTGLPLTVLDTTDPFTVLDTARRFPLDKTLFIVASKSGSTAEPLAFGEYFYAKVKEIKGERAGENFVAITDPDTRLVELATQRRFRRIFLNFADIGGRYSALSYFGLLPATLAGVDVTQLLERALRMQQACAACVTGAHNPSFVLGAALGELARRGRDKVTFLMPVAIETFGMWLEQLLAESTGKEGRGLVPVVGELPGEPSVYANDRVFVVYQLAGEKDPQLEKRLDRLQRSGHPVVTIHLEDRLDLGQEFLRWELATATAGAVLGINPFDQPNVQASKDNTNRLLDIVRQEGRLPEEQPALVEQPLSLYADEAQPSIVATLTRFLGQAHPGCYLALLAYLPEQPGGFPSLLPGTGRPPVRNTANLRLAVQPAVDRALQSIRLELRDALRIATTLGYGPRYLHSTGQLHKGGPESGLFVLLTARDIEDIPIPGAAYTFGVFKQAQALGDLQSLRQHHRRVIRLDLGPDLQTGLQALQEAIRGALQKQT